MKQHILHTQSDYREMIQGLRTQFPELFFRTYDVILLLLIFNAVWDVNNERITLGTLSLTILLAFVSLYALIIVRRFALSGPVEDIAEVKQHVIKVARMIAIFSSMLIASMLLMLMMLLQQWFSLQLWWCLIVIGIGSVTMGGMIFVVLMKRVTFIDRMKI